MDTLFERIKKAFEELADGGADSDTIRLLSSHIAEQDQRIAKLEAWVRKAATGEFDPNFQ